MEEKELSSVFLFKLETAAKRFRRYKNRIFKEHSIDITSDQWILLKNINEAPGISQTELAKRCKKETAAVTRTLDILEKKQWTTRQPDPKSRRGHKLFCTENGEKVVGKILPLALEIRKQARKNISEKELKMFNRLLDKIHSNLE